MGAAGNERLSSSSRRGGERPAPQDRAASTSSMKFSLTTLFVTGAAAFQAPSQSARSPIALEATRSEVAAAILGASALFAPAAAFAAR